MQVLSEQLLYVLWVQGCDSHFRNFRNRIHSKKNSEGFFFWFYTFAIPTRLQKIEKETLAFIDKFDAVRPAKGFDQSLIVSSQKCVFDFFELFLILKSQAFAAIAITFPIIDIDGSGVKFGGAGGQHADEKEKR